MGPAYYIIAILGCSDSGACEPVATASQRFESREACTAATPGALITASGFDFPTMVAECRPGRSPVSGGEQRPRVLPAGALRG